MTQLHRFIMQQYTQRSGILYALVSLAVLPFSDAYYTCQRSNDYGLHITCQRRNPYCRIVDDRRLLRQERQEILLAHNRIRREAAKGLLRRYGLPPAANMKKLEWDNDLANNAQAHVEVTCKLKHDRPNQRSTVEYAEVGQNIYITEVWNQKLVPDTWGLVVEELWGHEEAAKLRASTFGRGLTLRGHDLKSIGHLTQLLWADTEKVGCGKIVFEGRKGATSDLRTCDYGEGGNVIGGEMYAEGPACSACPDSHPYCDDGLCSRTAPYDASHYVSPSYGASDQQNYASSYKNTASVHQPASQSQQASFWWTAPTPRTFTTSSLVQSFQQHALPLQRTYNPNRHNSDGGQYAYEQQGQSQQYHQSTYNYQGYTVLRRRRRSTPSSDDSGIRRTRVL